LINLTPNIVMIVKFRNVQLVEHITTRSVTDIGCMQNCFRHVHLEARSRDRISMRWIIFFNLPNRPITVAARSKARTVFARSNAGILGSNPTQSMDVCVRLFCVCVILYVGSGIVTG
jgi:hypothetical protein